MSDLYHLAYISKNTISGARNDVEEQIKQILEVAQRNNPRKEITGALLYSGGYFCQVIEGPGEAVEELFECIQMDHRHGEVTVLHFEPIEDRSFNEWAMAFAGLDEKMRFNIEAIRDSKDELLVAEHGRQMVSVLERLITQHQAILK